MQRKQWLVCVLALGLTAVAGQGVSADQKSRARTPSADTTRRLTAYQVPAGTALLVTLRTSLDASQSSRGDQVEGVLWSPVVQNGVELIPAGSVVLGQVADIVRPTRREPAAFAVGFSVVTHSETRSQAMLTSRPALLQATAADEAAPVKKGQSLIPTIVPAGTAFVVTTSEPLLVRIPG